MTNFSRHFLIRKHDKNFIYLTICKLISLLGFNKHRLVCQFSSYISDVFCKINDT